MSFQVKLSDTFYESLEEHLEALVNFAQNPTEETYYDYISLTPMYEYDTQVSYYLRTQLEKIRSS